MLETPTAASSRIFIGGDFSRYNNAACPSVICLNAAGIRDNTFNPSISGAINTIAFNGSQFGNVVLVGGTSILAQYYAATGIQDPNFGDFSCVFGASQSKVIGIVVQGINRIVIAGRLYVVNNGSAPNRYCTVGVLNAAGSTALTLYSGLPGEFNSSYIASSVEATALAVKGDTILIARRATITGGPPTMVGQNNYVYRLGPGTISGSYNTGSGVVKTLAFHSGGKMLLGGEFTPSGSSAPIYLARLNANSASNATYTLDNTFTSTGPPNNRVNTLAVQTDAKVMIGGKFTKYGSTPRDRVARLTSAGVIDATNTVVPGVTFTWRKNGVLIPTAIDSTLTLVSGGTGITDRYLATATVNGQTATSNTVTVVDAPNVVIDPSTTTPVTAILAGAYNTITVNPGGIGQLTGNIRVLDSVIVKTAGTLRLGPWRILPTSSSTNSKFRVKSGATLSVGHRGGITLAPDTTGAINLARRAFEQDANYIYTAAATPITNPVNAVQFTGNGLPTRVRNLTDSTGVSVLNTGPGPGLPITLKLSAPTSIVRVLKITSAPGGDFDLNNKPLVLLSSAAGTALVVNNAGSGVVRGRAIVQRYINRVPTSGIDYRYYSSPVTGNMTVDSLRTTTFTPVITPGSSANVFQYDESRLGPGTSFEYGLTPPAALTTPLAVGKGYAVKLGANEMLSFRGTLTTGLQPSSPLVRSVPAGSVPDNRGWNLVGNPYPSPIDWSLLAPANADTANVGAAIYVYESTGPNAGVYIPYVSGVGRSPILATGQSFFVRVRKGKTAGQLTFNDSMRITSYDTLATFSRLPSPPQVSIALANRNGGSSTSRPPVVVYQNLKAKVVTGYSPLTDAYFIPANTSTSVQALSVTVTAPDPNEELTIKGVRSFSNGTIIPLTLRADRAGTYKLNFTIRVPSGVTVFLDDTLRLQRGSVNLSTQDTVNLTLTAQEAVKSTGRFSLRFVNTPLPVELTAFAVARRSPTAASLTWTTATEKANAYFEVEASTDGTAFRRLGQVPGQGTSSQSHSYSFADEDLARYAVPVVYYRLRQVDTDGTGSYSPVRSLSLSSLGAAPIKLVAYPQPASDLLHVLGATPGAMLVIDDLLGRRVYTAPMPTSNTADLLLPATLPAGTYLLRSGSHALRIVLQ
jgi:hypothetical protein